MNEPLIESARCPLCERSLGPGHRLLYNFRVCRECKDDLSNRRRAAFFIDVTCIWVLPSCIWEFVIPRGLISMHASLVALAALVFFGIKDGFRGRSPGKWLLGLRVIHGETHEPIGIARSLCRNLPIVALAGVHYAILMLPTQHQSLDLIQLALLAQLAFFLCLNYQISRGPRWGDGLAGTKVILASLAYRPPFDIRGARCQKCSYDLTGNVSGVCPECGTSVTAISRIKWRVKGNPNNQ